MQRVSVRCPRCDQPLGISSDMWGRYYLCGGCGFTAEDDDELHWEVNDPVPPPVNLNRVETYRPWHSVTRQ